VPPEAFPLPRVEGGARLVHQQHGWIGQQPDRDVHALAVAAREVLHAIVGAVTQTGVLQHAVDRRVDIGNVLEAGEHTQVLRDREPRIEGQRLRYPARLPRRTGDGPGVGGLDAGKDRQQRGLAGPVWPDACDALAGPHFDRNVAERGVRTVGLVQPHRLENHGWLRLHAARLTLGRRSTRTSEYLVRPCHRGACCSSATSSASPGGQR
jgi:hypothetical protein